MTISTTRPALIQVDPVEPRAEDRTLGAFLALTASLSDRVDARSLRTALVRLSDSPDPRLAIAAHVTALLVDGYPISRRLLDDLTAVVRDDVTPGHWQADSRAGAIALVTELGAAIEVQFSPAGLEAAL